MKKLLWVVLWLFGSFGGASADVAEPATDFASRVLDLQGRWADVYYKLPDDEQIEHYKMMLEELDALAAAHPKQAEPLVLKAIVLCTYAGAEWGIGSLIKVQRARDLLLKAIDLDPRALDASAFITLGNLYFRLPGWPISYGSNELAQRYLETALRLYPNGLDSNYFYAELLLDSGDYDGAVRHLTRALQAPLRAGQQLSDSKLREEAQKALDRARAKQGFESGWFSRQMPPPN